MERLYIEAVDGKTILIFVRHIIAVMPAGDGCDIVTPSGTYYTPHPFQVVEGQLNAIIDASMKRGVA